MVLKKWELIQVVGTSPADKLDVSGNTKCTRKPYFPAGTVSVPSFESNGGYGDWIILWPGGASS